MKEGVGNRDPPAFKISLEYPFKNLFVLFSVVDKFSSLKGEPGLLVYQWCGPVIQFMHMLTLSLQFMGLYCIAIFRFAICEGVVRSRWTFRSTLSDHFFIRSLVSLYTTYSVIRAQSAGYFRSAVIKRGY